ncbi:MAG: ABC-type transport auxiliary lipoprotein family protein [Burkholderiaceae bacterium]
MKAVSEQCRNLSQCLLAVGLCLTVSACGGLAIGGQQAMNWYTLSDQALESPSRVTKPIVANPTPNKPTKAGALLIGPITSNPFYDSTQLAYSRSDIARAYYQFASWTERPTKRLAVLIEQRLTARSQFEVVASSTAGIRGDLLLNLTLDEMYHDTTASPPLARVVVRAVLVDPSQRRQLAQQRFENTSLVANPDAVSAVRAINAATTSLLDDLSSWVEQQSHQRPTKPSS